LAAARDPNNKNASAAHSCPTRQYWLINKAFAIYPRRSATGFGYFATLSGKVGADGTEID
jgi:hypothetical protein